MNVKDKFRKMAQKYMIDFTTTTPSPIRILAKCLGLSMYKSTQFLYEEIARKTNLKLENNVLKIPWMNDQYFVHINKFTLAKFLKGLEVILSTN